MLQSLGRLSNLVDFYGRTFPLLLNMMLSSIIRVVHTPLRYEYGKATLSLSRVLGGIYHVPLCRRLMSRQSLYLLVDFRGETINGSEWSTWTAKYG